MRGRGFFVVLALVLGGSAAVSWGAEAPAVPKLPKLVLDRPDHSFGEVRAGTPIRYTFKLKNQGQAPLRILSVKPTCGCMAGAYDSLLAPGRTGQITLTVADTKPYSGRTVKTATVTTNDPQHQRLILTLRADFLPLRPKPPELQ